MPETGEKIVAIITARGGSKRIPKKNIKPFVGRPIIAYSIEAALQSGCFDEVMVSTDDKQIAAVAKRCGAQAPFYRSNKNSGDHATTADVITEVITDYKKLGKEFAYCCCLYPTAPFVTPAKLKEAVTLLRTKGVDTVFPVVRFSFPIQRALKIEQGFVKMIWPQNLNKRSQDLMPAYHDAGQFYCMKTASFLKQRKLYAAKSIGLVCSEMEVQDIDTIDDWKVAEVKYKILHNIQ